MVHMQTLGYRGMPRCDDDDVRGCCASHTVSIIIKLPQADEKMSTQNINRIDAMHACL